MFCNYVSRTDHSYTYSYLDRFKYYDLIRHKVYATTTKQRGRKMTKLNCEDDARDLSIILTDKILNKFDRTTPDETTAFDPDKFPCDDGFKGAIIPTDENYSFALQDLITEIICKEYKIERED